MEIPGTCINRDDGAMMILMSMMLLALLTIISVAASKTAITEIKIAGNEYLYQHNFYCAEGAAIETVDKMEALASVDVDSIGWLMNESEKVEKDSDLYVFWTDVNRDKDEARPGGASVCAEHTEFMAVHHGVLAGSSLDMSKPTKHIYSIYGRSLDRGLVLIKIGYTKAF
jgi:hypothetical protein